MVVVDVGGLETEATPVPCSDAVSAAVTCAVPSGAPHNFTAVGAGATGVRLRWDPPARRHRNGAIVMYELVYHARRDPADDSATNSSDTSLVVDGLERGADYVFHVRAYTSRGAGPWSSQLPYHRPTAALGQPRPLSARHCQCFFYSP